MAKLTERELQLRALREARFSSRDSRAASGRRVTANVKGPEGKPSPEVPLPGMRTGSREDTPSASAPHLTQPVKVEVNVSDRGSKFDRNAYQREYMKKWRARKKGE